MRTVIFALLASIVWGSAPLLFKLGLKGNVPYLVALIIHNFTAFAVALLAFLLSGEKFEVSSRELLAIALGGFMSGFLGLFLFFVAIKSGHISVASPIASTSPLWTALFAYVLLGEPINVTKALGILMAVTGIVLISLSSR